MDITVWRQDAHTDTHKVHLAMRSLRIIDLHVHKKRKPGSLDTTSLAASTPNPQVIIQA